ncbi:hypothetical protein VMCG_06030 [Cytospora schulzeri]|uniref:Uncharacterized protein n=1 Tax=Cytospora schulzeri TaxID=448051 RepID=A0A423WGN3_9PEZI|nr:hypothetical protein VMCG_06030 [Valsa malicola]
MADLPNQRVPTSCSAQRPGETDDDYFLRWKAHRDAWRQQFLDDYYRPKETRLPSPDSEEDLDEEETLQAVRFVERCIRLENGQPEPGDLPNRVQPPPVVYPPGKSLSEIDEYEPGPFSPIPSRRPEDEEFDRVWQTMRDLNPETNQMRKRSSSPAEDGAIEPPAKRRRTDTKPEIRQAGPSTSGHKRKRVQDANLDEPQVAEEQVQTSPKKRRTNTHSRRAPTSTTSISKRKRQFDANEAHEHEVQAPSRQGWEVSGAKRRRVDETIPNDAAGRREHSRTTRNAREKTAATSSPRLTRARRRQLSGQDAQLFQLGQRGQIDPQGQDHEKQAQNAESATDESRRRRSAATKTGPKLSNTTNLNAKVRANNTNANTNTKAKAKAKAGNNTSTMNSAGTKARRGRPNR